MEKDISWKEYFRDDERYADVINGIGFGGRQLVTGVDLEEADTQTIFSGMQDRSLGTAITSGRRRMRRIRTRDMLRKVAFGVSFAMIGLENQELVDIRRLRDTDIFKTDVKQVFDFIRCAEDKKELFKLVQGDESFRCMEEDAYEVATNYAGAEELIKVKDEYRGKDGKIDMCQALKELLADERMEGRKELALRMYLDGSLNIQTACVYLECTQEEFMGYVKTAEKRLKV